MLKNLMEKFDVIINGAGFAGLSLACGLAAKNLSIAIIEPQPISQIQNSADSRTTALSYFSRKYFESVGVWHKILEDAGAINHIKILDANYTKGDSILKLNFSKDDVATELGENCPMGYIVENSKFKSALIEHCLKQKNIKFFDSETISFIEQTANFITADLTSDITLQAKMLVAADGKNSPVREMLKIEFFEKDYNQTAITFNITHEFSHNKTAIERFMPTGPFAVLPMSDEYNSSIVWTVERDSAPVFMSLNQDDFKSQVQKRLQNNLGDFKLISKPTAYPLKLKYAKNYYQGRAVLIADSAHAIHPIAGQGFNQGCKDLSLLVNLISENAALGLDIAAEDLLSNYEKTRMADNKQMILATDIFNQLFSNDNKIISTARRLGIASVNSASPIKKFFIKHAMGAR